MPDDALLLTENDLRPLSAVPGHIIGAIDAVEDATLALHRGAVSDATFLGHPQPNGRPSARLSLATAPAIATGVRVFGTPAPDYLGLARAANTRSYLLLDGATGQVVALMDYSRLNPLRVGAVGGLAARHLAPPGSETLGILGSGQQARTQVQAICKALPGITHVLVYSPTPAHREAFAHEMGTWLGVRAEAVDTVEAATREADIVALATSSNRPVLRRAQVKPSALVISITEGQLPAEFVDTSCAVFIAWDLMAQNLVAREPYAPLVQAGAFTRADLAAELIDVVAGEATPRRTPDDVVVFELAVVNAYDLAIAQWAYTWARANGVGTPFVLSTA